MTDDLDLGDSRAERADMAARNGGDVLRVPELAAPQVRDSPGWGDNIERYLVILFLGLGFVGCVAGIIGLSYVGKDVPDAMQLIAATAGGALGGMLSPIGQNR